MTRLQSYALALAILLPATCYSQIRQEALTLGLLLPGQGHSVLIQAAEAAIDEANRAGGYKSREFRLQVRTAEGFWGAGSKESVSLVYEDQVRAIVGYLDGRNGHLAEQVAAKSHLSYIETYATDPTLSQAFVPWFMRVVPNDDQQALALVKQIQKEGGGKVLVLSTGTYDCRYAIKSLTQTLARELGLIPVVLSLDTTAVDPDDLSALITRHDPEHLIIPFGDPFQGALVQKLKTRKPGMKMYGTLHFTLAAEKWKEEWVNLEGMYLLGPIYPGKPGSMLQGSEAAFIYDAFNLVINAIRNAGTEREAITEYISKSTYSNGATGTISFDELGNRTQAARLYRVRNGSPQLIE